MFARGSREAVIVVRAVVLRDDEIVVVLDPFVDVMRVTLPRERTSVTALVVEEKREQGGMYERDILDREVFVLKDEPRVVVVLGRCDRDCVSVGHGRETRQDGVRFASFERRRRRRRRSGE